MPRRGGGISASGAPGRLPSSCPYLGAASPGSLGRCGPLLVCVFEGQSCCLWRPLSKAPTHLRTPVCCLGAQRPQGRLLSGCLWFVLRAKETQDDRVKIHIVNLKPVETGMFKHKKKCILKTVPCRIVVFKSKIHSAMRDWLKTI